MVLGFKTISPITKQPTKFQEKIVEGKKIHTIREGDRWRAGMKIHFATGVRTKRYTQFNSGIVTSVQNIHIAPPFEKDGYTTGLILIDGNGLNEYTKSLLATNDGFDSINDFWLWFKEGIHGQIIHWTGYKY
jgi:hypothetical protein